MKLAGLTRSLLRVLALLAVLAAFAVLDWYPTVKDLGRLRRQRNDAERKIIEYGVMAARIQFPDEAERARLASADAELLRALTPVDSDAGWLAVGLTDFQDRLQLDGIPQGIMLFDLARETGIATPPTGRADALAGWFRERGLGSARVFPAPSLRHGIVPDPGPNAGGRLAGRDVVMVLAAPLPDLLRFINHVSWGEARMEVVRLYLEPGVPLCRAWLVCRGHYRVAGPSPWRVEPAAGAADMEPLVDPDSPLLLQRVDPLLAPRIEKRELPVPGSPW